MIARVFGKKSAESQNRSGGVSKREEGSGGSGGDGDGPGADGGGGHAVLAGAGFRDDALLAEFLAHERLAEGVVDLVRPRVVQVLALEVNLSAVVLRQPSSRVEAKQNERFFLRSSVKENKRRKDSKLGSES